MTHHRITVQGRDSWTAQQGRKHTSSRRGVFREERRWFAMLVRDHSAGARLGIPAVCLAAAAWAFFFAFLVDF